MGGGMNAATQTKTDASLRAFLRTQDDVFEANIGRVNDARREAEAEARFDDALGTINNSWFATYLCDAVDYMRAVLPRCSIEIRCRVSRGRLPPHLKSTRFDYRMNGRRTSLAKIEAQARFLADSAAARAEERIEIL